MNSDEVMNILSSITVGTVIAWIIVLIAIVSAIGACFIKMYKVFDKAKKVKDENDTFKTLVAKHDETLSLMKEELAVIRNEQQDAKKRELRKLRHSITRAGEEALADQKISIRKLRSLEELYEDYTTNFVDENGKPANGYVKSLMNKVRRLDVIGKLDENDEDIE